mmetsp:Transcript_13714/g.39144  ORF Transcript_13714/g.39144 Transcript_13714/m.39144 type:complete len:181 (-) Transcript_13714:1791-2333(-)
MDDLLLAYLLAGLMIGAVWLAILPSQPTSDGAQHQPAARTASDTAGTIPATTTNITNTTNADPTRARPRQQQHAEKEWAGEDIPPEQLERIRKRFRLTNEQMEAVLQESRLQLSTDGQKSASASSLSWTPHQTLNGMTYCIILGVVVYVFNRDYDGIVTKVFLQWFPREAATLGLVSQSY